MMIDGKEIIGRFGSSKVSFSLSTSREREKRAEKMMMMMTLFSSLLLLLFSSLMFRVRVQLCLL